MDELIPIVNTLQEILTSVGLSGSLDLPQIVVVGAQSVGKSSLLEALVGRAFLPRGTGIVTRRPLILQLCNAVGEPEWGEFGHRPNDKFDDFDRIRTEIEAETDRHPGPNKLVSPKPILLRIFSPTVIDLTLVDLPGLTKVPVADQPPDIDRQVWSMALHFASKPSALILAVTAANTDLANSDSLRLAREVDPNGLRTIGVITKCDVVDEWEDAINVLTGKLYPLKLGYVGVVCRSSQQVRAGILIRDSISDEERFFSNHPGYRMINQRCGTTYLAQTLNRFLVQHIQKIVPNLRVHIQEIIKSMQDELLKYGDTIDQVSENPGALILHYFTKFSKQYQDSIDGKIALVPRETALTGGARLNYIFHDWYTKAIAEFHPLDGLGDNEIRATIRNANGPKAALFVPEGAFEILVKKQIQLLEKPSLLCVDQVYTELQNIVEKCELPEINRFTQLRDRMNNVVREVLTRCVTPTNSMIHNLIQIELAYINTNHPDFMNYPSLGRQTLQENITDSTNIINTSDIGVLSNSKEIGTCLRSGAIPSNAKLKKESSTIGQETYLQLNAECNNKNNQVPNSASGISSARESNKLYIPGITLPCVPAFVGPPDIPSERERIETELIKSLIWSYFNIVRKNIADAVPKTIMHFMVNASKEAVQKELVTQLYKDNMFDLLLCESDQVRSQRTEFKRQISELNRALAMLNKIKDDPHDYPNSTYGKAIVNPTKTNATTGQY